MTDTESVPSAVPQARVTMIGGSGGMGAFVLTELVTRGVAVRAIVRRPNAVEPDDLVEVVDADAYRTAELAEALRGTQTLVSAFNPGWGDDDVYANFLRGSRSICDAARQAEVDRLIVVGGASSLVDADGRQLIETFQTPEPYASGVRAAFDYLGELSGERELDWVYFSPPPECGPIGPTGRTGRFRIGGDEVVRDDRGRSALSREDLAVAVVDEALEPAHHRERFTAAY